MKEPVARRWWTVLVVVLLAPVLVAGIALAVVPYRQRLLGACLIGSWRASSHVATVTTHGSVATNWISGLLVRYRTDGTMEQNYTAATARLDGELTPLSGTVTFAYRLRRDTLSYTDGRTSDQTPEQDYAETAACGGGRLTLTGDDSHARWTITLTRL